MLRGCAPILTTVGLFISIYASGQLQISGMATYGSFSMKSLREYHAAQAGRVEDTTKVLTEKLYDFPAYWGMKFSGRYRIKKNLVGIYGGFQITGARSHYSDFSGEIKLDKIVKCVPFGLSYSYNLLDKPVVKLWAGGDLGFSSSTLTSESLVEYYLVDEKKEESDIYKSIQTSLTPTIHAELTILRGLFGYVEAGYLVQFFSTSQKSASGNKLEYDKSAVKPNWTGYRLGAGLGFKFPK